MNSLNSFRLVKFWTMGRVLLLKLFPLIATSWPSMLFLTVFCWVSVSYYKQTVGLHLSSRMMKCSHRNIDEMLPNIILWDLYVICTLQEARASSEYLSAYLNKAVGVLRSPLQRALYMVWKMYLISLHKPSCTGKWAKRLPIDFGYALILFPDSSSCFLRWIYVQLLAWVPLSQVCLTLVYFHWN